MSLPIKLKLPEFFLKQEVRCEYLVSEKMKKVWAVELDLLNELLRVCKKYNIKVQMAYGSLLGVIRHKGFIPWDDDLDVFVTREGYEKLCSIAEKEFLSPYFWQTALTDPDYFIPIGRLKNSKTTAAIMGFDRPSYNNGIFIDVYILDGYSDSSFGRRAQQIQRQILDIILLARQKYPYVGPNLKDRIALFLRKLRPLLCLLPYKTYVKWYESVVKRYNDASQKFSVLTNSADIERSALMRSVYEDIMEVEIENFLKVPIPKAYDEVLKKYFGDYMNFPPVEDRGKWHDGTLTFDPETPYLKYLAERRS